MKKMILGVLALISFQAFGWSQATQNGFTYFTDGSHIAVPIPVGQSTGYYTVYNFGNAINAFIPSEAGYTDVYITANQIWQMTAQGWQQLGCDLSVLKKHRDDVYRSTIQN